MKSTIGLILVTCLFMLGVNAQTATPCVDSSYRKIFYVAQDTIGVIEQIPLRNGDYLMAGQYIPVGGIKEGFLLRLDPQGNKVWSTHIKDPLSGQPIILKRLLELSTGELIVGGKIMTTGSTASNYIFLAKLDPLGNLLWQRTYTIQSTIDINPDIYLSSLCEGAQQDILVAASVNGRLVSGFIGWYGLVLRTDNAGSPAFSKIFVDQQASENSLVGIYYHRGSVLLWGFANDNKCLGLDPRSIYNMTLDYANGTMLTSAGYCFVPAGMTSYSWSPYSFKAVQTPQGFAVNGHLAEGGTNREICHLRFDPELKLLNNYALSKVAGMSFATQINASSSNGSVNVRTKGAVNQRVYLTGSDVNGQTLWQRSVPGEGTGYQPFREEGGTRISNTGNTPNYVTSYLLQNQSVIEWMHVQPSSAKSECTGMDTSFAQVQPFPVYESTVFWTAVIDQPISNQTSYFLQGSLPLSTSLLCSAVSTCSQVSLEGRDTVCVLGQPELYKARRNDMCLSPVRWHFDTMQCQRFRQINDTTLEITWRMKKPGAGVTQLIASFENCPDVQDTLSIQLYPIAQVLPKDLVFCPGDTVALTVGHWFRHYTWQDGSNDSFFVARSPGKYWVNFQSYCPYRGSDTTVIKGLEQPILGKHVYELCQGDSVIIEAFNNFSSYTWYPNYYSQLTAASFRLRAFPPTDTQYVVEALVRPGCVVKDTAYIRLQSAPAIDIRADSSQCGIVTLRSIDDGKFVQYNWSTGDTHPTISLQQPGLVHLTATYQNSCQSEKVITIKIPDCEQQAFFPNAFSPNGDGQNDIFKPVIHGSLTKFEFSVYNHWGQLLFTTKTVGKGWDGRVQGKLQPDGAYVWVCILQQAGKNKTVHKGTVVMVK